MLNQRTFNEKANYCEIMQIQHIFCGRLSPVSLLMFGVPQGSVLRPLLYVLYTAELDYVVACHQIPYTCMPTTVESASARQSSMSLFCSIDLLLVCTTLTTGWRWADALKTQVMWLGSSQQLQQLNIPHVNILSICVDVDTACDLGVTIDSQLSLSAQPSCCIQLLRLLSAATTPPDHPLTDNGSS